MPRLILNAGQQSALNHLQKFLRIPINSASLKTCCATLSGYAGTGKTTLTRKLVDSAKLMNLTVMGVAPTHKARKVLHYMLNSDRSVFSVVIQSITVASMLYKLRQHSYIGSKNYRSRGGSKFSQADLFLIDEVSMITDEDFELIVKFAQSHRKKVIFIGDPAQIPNPSQGLKLLIDPQTEARYLIKKTNQAFELENHYQLTELMRQSKDNPVIKIYQQLRNNLDSELDLSSFQDTCSDAGIWINQYDQFIEQIKSCLLQQPLDTLFKYRIISYTNDSVNQYNQLVRQILSYTEPFVRGELLMGYQNIGYPERIIENGQDYQVINLQKTTSHVISYLHRTKRARKEHKKYSNLVGTLVTIMPIFDNAFNNNRVLFFPEITSSANNSVFSQLIVLAERNNQTNSTLMDFQNYQALKETLIFKKNIYRIKSKTGYRIVSEQEMKNLHPLLLTNVNEIIKEVVTNGPERATTKAPMGMYRTVVASKLGQQIKAKYPKLIEQRLRDLKSLSENEKLIDRFQIVEKDIDYGYAITAHKAQGSTYHTVFIDQSNFDLIRNRWNYHYQALESRIREKNQLKYVAFTRPSERAIVYSSASLNVVSAGDQHESK
jgi:hypothetical protein